VNITPSPLTAALAGTLAGLAWPWLWARFGGPGAAGSTELVVATLLVIALPAHAFVVGFRPPAGGRSLDTALLQRIGAWLASALITAGLVTLATNAGTP
jgi:hypothetical protein